MLTLISNRIQCFSDKDNSRKPLMRDVGSYFYILNFSQPKGF